MPSNAAPSHAPGGENAPEPSSPAASGPAGAPRWAAPALLALLAAYGVLLAFYVGAVAGGSDNSGYFNEARLLAHLSVHTRPRVLEGVPAAEAPPYLYIPLGFKPAAGDASRIVPTYPPGLPLLLAPVARIVGWRHAGDVALVLHALAGLALTFALGRRCGLPAGWSLLGSAVLAASPLYLYTSLQALSDVPATAWSLAAVLAAWKSRERAGWALAAGIALAVAFLVRPSNFMLAIPMAVAFGPSVRRWLLCAVGALPGIAAWLAINHAAYGGYLQSGYGAIGNEFHGALVGATLRYCARWLPNLFGPIIIAAPAVLILARARPRPVAVLASWALAYLCFYSAYRWTHEDWWFLRFLLPAAPAMIVSGLLVVATCFRMLRASMPGSLMATLAAILVVACLGAETAQVYTLEAWSIGRGERKYERACDWLNANVPRNSVVIANQFSGALFYFTGFTVLRADQIDPSTAARILSAARAGRRPLYAVFFTFEEPLLSRVPSRWAVVTSVDDVLIQRCTGIDH
jgi:4-amino-4-deoxy-L-arabinose transferase-like glycosyltransferase